MLAIAVGCASIVAALVSCDVHNARRNTSAHKENHPTWYNRDFPEQSFRPPTIRSAVSYDQKVAEGYITAKSKRVVFVSLARDVASHLPTAFARIESMGAIFKEYKFVIFENDSRDGTRQIIRTKSLQDRRIDLMECPESSECRLNSMAASSHGLIHKTRFEKMAKYRNLCLEHVRKFYSDYDYMVVIDIDLVGPVSVDGFAHCFSYPMPWDAMCANGMVSRPLSMGASLYRYDSLARLMVGSRPESSKIGIVARHLCQIARRSARRGEKPVLVRSEFNGAAIYQLPRLLSSGASYSGTYCEHVSLHLDMSSRGLDQIFMNPSFMLLHVSRFDVTL